MVKPVKQYAFDVSIVLTAHHEGRVMHSTIRSLALSIDHAQRHGLTVELVLILDGPDEQTAKYVEQNVSSLFGNTVPTTIRKVEFADPAPARNYGTNLARGRFVGVLDGDDLFSENLITVSIETLRQSKRPVIVHPEYLVSFGRVHEIWHLSGSEDPEFDVAAIVEYNPWPLPSFASREVREAYKYKAVNPDDAFGPEDWQWNVDTLEAGITHVLAPKTVYFYRRKLEKSLLSTHNALHVLLRRAAFLGNRNVKPLRPNAPVPEEVYRYKTISQVLSIIPRFMLARVGRAIGPTFRRHKRTQAFEHYMRIAFSELLATSAPVSHDTENRQYFAWLLDEWRRQHEFEHTLYPDSGLLQRIDNHKPVTSLFSSLYWGLLKEVPVDVDYVFLIPWLKTGGADLVIINYVTAILKSNPLAKVAVIATEITSSPWRNRLPKAAKFIPLDEKFYALEPERQTKLLATLLVQAAPKNIHLINSAVGFRTFAEYAKQLSKASRLFVCAFCFDYLPSGQRVSYLLDHLGYFIDYVERVLTDNEGIINDLALLQALPREKFNVHYQPYSGSITEPKQIPSSFSGGKPLKVLWAGRLDRQKRPDTLMAIASEVKRLELPVEFHVYGNQVLDDDRIVEKLAEHSNIDYHGGFSGFSTLPLANFHVYLSTTEYEGLPNILLEATAGGLPIIAPAVGGIPEFIESGKTGYLVSAYNDIQEYIDTLKEVLDNPEQAYDYLVNAQRLLATRHGWKSFMHVLSLDKYIDGEGRTNDKAKAPNKKRDGRLLLTK